MVGTRKGSSEAGVAAARAAALRDLVARGAPADRIRRQVLALADGWREASGTDGAAERLRSLRDDLAEGIEMAGEDPDGGGAAGAGRAVAGMRAADAAAREWAASGRDGDGGGE